MLMGTSPPVTYPGWHEAVEEPDQVISAEEALLVVQKQNWHSQYGPESGLQSLTSAVFYRQDGDAWLLIPVWSDSPNFQVIRTAGCRELHLCDGGRHYRERDCVLILECNVQGAWELQIAEFQISDDVKLHLGTNGLNFTGYKTDVVMALRITLKPNITSSGGRGTVSMWVERPDGTNVTRTISWFLRYLTIPH